MADSDLLGNAGTYVAPAGYGAGSPSILASGDASDAAAAANAAKKAVLDKIASGEADRYNELYKGGSFEGYGDHPRIRQVITEGPHKGETSDAAGRYMFLSSTWDSQAKKLGLKDFSPASQDTAAWDLANSTYKSTTGRDLLSDARQGKVDYSKLSGQWPSLSGGGTSGGSRDASSSAALPTTNGADSADSTNPAEAIQAQMKLAFLRNMFQNHSITQVDYDPFKELPKNLGDKVNVNQ